MRFCPFCTAENNDEQAVCASCGRRLPPLPPRRARNAPPTGVQLPPRASATAPPPLPRRTGGTVPPPVPASGPQPAASAPPPTTQPAPTSSPPAAPASGPQPAAAAAPPILPIAPGTMVSPGAMTAPPGSHAPLPVPSVSTTAPNGAAPGRESAPALPPPPAADEAARRALAHAITPGPAAHRREPPPPAPSEGADARRKSDRPAIPGSGPRTPPPPAPTPHIPKGAFDDDFNTMADQQSIDARLAIESTLPPPPSGVTPPPTRLQVGQADRPFTPPRVHPIPEIPEPGLYSAARYTLRFARARWQRRGAIKLLQTEIKQDTEALDQVLGALGRVARTARVDGRVFSSENNAINAAEERVAILQKEHAEVDGRKAEENSKFVDVERERTTKMSEAERMVDEASKELAHLEGQRRSMRDQRKELERRQRAYLKSAEDSDRQAGNAQMGDARADLRRTAEQYRKEAAALEPDRQEVDRRLAGLERPIGEAAAKLDAAKAELDAAKRSMSDAREGHTHRLAELDAEQKRKAREIAQAEAEISRRLVTLGTLVNLNRIDDPQFVELYERIDRLRGAITARTTEIEKLSAEREAYDRGSLVRGVSAMGGAVVALIALIVILRALI